MKVRIGVGAGPSRTDPAAATLHLVDGCERRGIDSVWFPDRIAAPAIEPLTALAWSAGRTSSLKLGTGVVVLPGRNPAIVAAQLASLAALAPKRILPVFGLRPATPAERTSYPVPGPRAAVFEEALTVLRRLLSEESVTHHGEFFTLDDAAVGPRPARPLDLWLGGLVPAALDRVGRLADGWLASFVTPAEADAARRDIAAAADRADREVEADHYGTNLLVLPPGTPDDERDRALASSAHRRPDIDPTALVADGWPQARSRVGEFVAAGITKFVVRPATTVTEPDSWDDFLDGLAAELGPLETPR